MTPRRPWVRWVLALVALLVFVAAPFIIERVSSVDATGALILRIGFIVLGIALAGAIIYFLRPEPVRRTGPDDALLMLKAASGRLPGGSLGTRPLLVVFGPEGSAKTSLVAHSRGANAELLAGAAPSTVTDAPVPTAHVNVWLVQDTVVTEIGGAAVNDDTRWTRITRALRAPRLSSAFKSNAVVPRSAIVCVPCDLFESADGAAAEASARQLRERLTLLSRELGLRVPVYVVFTKADRIPHFEEWVATLTRDEVRAPLGASLSFDTDADMGTWVERTSRRIDAAMQRLLGAMQERRVELLAREGNVDRRFSAYEFPRELRKRLPAMSKFLVELCRPTQLAASPQLRGFYLVGARPVLVADQRAAAVAAPVASTASADATAIFRQGGAPAAPMATGGASTSRKIPEWVFLEQLLRDAVLGDTGAASAARSGVRVQRTRRALSVAAIAACVVLLIGLTTSWVRNRNLQARVTDASRAVAQTRFADDQPGQIVMPSAEGLRRLDVLRGLLDTVRMYEHEGAPLSMRFGLWRGQQILAEARPVWYESFRRQLYASSWRTLQDSLRGLPDAPRADDDYSRAYGWLRAYLVNTTETNRSEVSYVAPVMLATWQRDRALDADVVDLARDQFEFYADDLREVNYFNASGEQPLVTRARGYLAQFSGGEQLYRSLLSAADAAVPALELPQGRGVLTTPARVNGAFTKQGAAFMTQAFRDSDRFTSGDKWVVGDVAAANEGDHARVVTELQNRYAVDYVTRWTDVLRGTSVSRPASAADAATKLQVLSGAQSPLLQLLAVTAQQTAIPLAQASFQPVIVTVDTAAGAPLVNDVNRPYMDGLLGLQSAMAELAGRTGRDSVAIAEIQQRALSMSDQVGRARMAAGQVVQRFTSDAQAQPVSQLVQSLLQAPIAGADGILQDMSRLRARAVVARGGGGGGGAAPPPPANPAARALNDAGVALCRSFGPTVGKFPFNPESPQEATFDEVQKLLVQEYGELWAFQKGALAPYLSKQGNQWVARAANNIELSPEFVAFFNKAARVSEALFPQGRSDPRFDVYVSGRVDDNVPEIAFRHDVKDTPFNKQTFDGVVTWPAARANVARLSAKFKKNRRFDLVDSTGGPWALFRLVSRSQYEGGDRSGTATWTPRVKDASPVRLVFTYPNGHPMLQPGWMGSQLDCVPQVTK